MRINHADEFLCVYPFEGRARESIIYGRQDYKWDVVTWLWDITMTSWWPQWRLKSSASRLFTQPFIQTQIKENIKALRNLPFEWGIHRDRRIPRTNGQLRGKCIHLMTSSWKCDSNLKITLSRICKHGLIWRTSCEIALRWIPRIPVNNASVTVTMIMWRHWNGFRGWTNIYIYIYIYIYIHIHIYICKTQRYHHLFQRHY